ncbi:PAS domain-containing protein [Nitrospirota bacterium]
MENRIKKAFKKAYENENFEYSALMHIPDSSIGHSKLAVAITVLGWLVFFAYFIFLVDVPDLMIFLETSLSPESEGIRYRALLFFAPIILSIIGYLADQIYRTFRISIAYQGKLEELARTLDVKVKEQTQALEESNASIKAEMRAKEEAYSSLLLLEKAVKTMNTGITFKDTENIIRFINEADASMHGYKPSELIGKDASILTSAGKIRKLDIEKLKQIKSWARESENKRKDGSTFPVLLVSDAVFDDSGHPLGTVTTCQDISDKVILSENLQEALREKEILSKKIQQLTGDNQ